MVISLFESGEEATEKFLKTDSMEKHQSAVLVRSFYYT
jgi:hypothetical protein